MDLSKLVTDRPVTAVDPNVLLRELREAAQNTMKDLDDPELSEEVAANEAAMATAFMQLDDWMARGGFPPAPWSSDDA